MNSIIKNITILAIDDEPLNLTILAEFLEGRCQRLFLESDIDSALALARKEQPDIILLDILMGDVNGYEVCRGLKADEHAQAIPVIFLSSLSKGSDKVKGFEAGGVDYISKPFEIEEVIARIENCLRLHQQINQKYSITAQKQKKLITNYQLTTSEIKILSLYVVGLQRNEIGLQLFISENTVKTHLKKLFVKLKIKNRTEAITKAREMGLVE